MIRPGLLTASRVKLTTSECLLFVFVFLSALSLLLRLILFFERVFPPRSERRNTTGLPTPHTGGRNEVEHSQRKRRVCADGLVVYDEAERGESGFERYN